MPSSPPPNKAYAQLCSLGVSKMCSQVYCVWMCGVCVGSSCLHDESVVLHSNVQLSRRRFSAVGKLSVFMWFEFRRQTEYWEDDLFTQPTKWLE